MPSKTPKRSGIPSHQRSPNSPKTPGWVSGKDAVFLSPKSLSPKKPNTRRTSVYRKMKPLSPEFKPITQMISPKGVMTRSRRSSMFGVYRKGGIRLIDIPITPDNKKVSPIKSRARRSSMYKKDIKKEVQPKSQRRMSVQPRLENIIPKPPAKKVTQKAPVKPTTRNNGKRYQVDNEISIKSNTDTTEMCSPVVSLVDVISPSKESSQFVTLNIKSTTATPLNKSKSQESASITKKSQGKKKAEKSISDTGIQNLKTPVLTVKSSPSKALAQSSRSVKKSVRKSSRKTPARPSPEKTKQLVKNTPKVDGKEIDETMLITFKTPAIVSVQKSARKRKATENISPPAKKCILDLSPVEKIPYKTPHKLDKSPVLMLKRTPLADVFTSTPRETSAFGKTPLKAVTGSGRKGLKQSKKSFSKAKKVSIITNLKTPDYNRPSLTSTRKATPAKACLENYKETEASSSLSGSDFQVSPKPTNITILSDHNTNSIVSNSPAETTSHSSAGRCTIL